MDDGRQEILNLVRRQEEAVRRGDAAGVVDIFASDAVSFDLPPPLQHSGAELLDPAGMEEWFATWDGPVSVTMRDPAVHIDGDLAVVFGLSRMQGTKKGSGLVDSWSRRTIVLKRLDGIWKVVHEHSSFPMAMDGSGRAVTDAEPGD
jgi:uncharacterized protein (TIGR02246 family)